MERFSLVFFVLAILYGCSSAEFGSSSEPQPQTKDRTVEQKSQSKSDKSDADKSQQKKKIPTIENGEELEVPNETVDDIVDIQDDCGSTNNAQINQTDFDFPVSITASAGPLSVTCDSLSFIRKSDGRCHLAIEVPPSFNTSQVVGKVNGKKITFNEAGVSAVYIDPGNYSIELAVSDANNYASCFVSAQVIK